MYKTITWQKIFLLITIFYGSILLIITPAFQTQDEVPHFIRAYSVSDNIWTPQKKDVGVGSYMPISINSFWLKYKNLLFNPFEKITIKEILDTSKIKLNKQSQMFIIHRTSMVYSPLAYIPYAIFLKIAKIFNFSPFIMLYTCRIVSLIIYLIIGYFAIKNMPLLKSITVVVLTYPMHIALCSSITIDAILIPLGVLFFAKILKFTICIEEKEISRKEFFLLIILAISLALIKYNFILTFLIFLIPKRFFGRNYIKKIIIFFSLTLYSSFLWFCYCGDMTFETFKIANWHEQLNFILENKIRYLTILFETIRENYKFYYMSSIGILGNINIKLPKLVYIIYLFLIPLSIFYDSSQKKEMKKLNFLKQIFIIFLFIIHTFAVFTLMYITFNPVKNNIINGVHGRYFAIFLLPLFVILFQYFHKYSK